MGILLRLSFLIIALAGPAAAQDWTALSGAGIRAALEGRVVQFEAARQDFRASGRTLYQVGGRDSWGYWRIEDDRYCSQWPPSDLWACYRVEVLGAQLRFIGVQGDSVAGRYVN